MRSFSFNSLSSYFTYFFSNATNEPVSTGIDSVVATTTVGTVDALPP
jgi:hypothetical protein